MEEDKARLAHIRNPRGVRIDSESSSYATLRAICFWRVVMVFKKGNNLPLFFRGMIVVTKEPERQEYGEHLRAYYGCPHVKSLMRSGRALAEKQ